ncbi:helix-turn-helix transcriptional regulator [Nonomuraea sp. NPDC050202]|uniref:helix-turn-helix domain-containing protein n=1 Tax=Nonomuraea sp. NPDC050202 TaxID=3155035 RepID=UPI0033CEB201
MIKAVPDPEPDDEATLATLQPRYEWRLRELMAVRKNWYTTTKLIPELRKHGFVFDRSSIFRLVKADKPPKMPIELILALCKILDCRFEDLVVPLEPDDQATTTGSQPPARPRQPLPEGPLLPASFFDAES